MPVALTFCVSMIFCRIVKYWHGLWNSGGRGALFIFFHFVAFPF